MRSQEIINLTEQYSAKNYSPLPVVIERGKGVWVTDVDGNEYMDMLSSYSALNQGHRHPKIIKALQEQAEKLTITSRAFHNDKLGQMCKQIAQITGKDKVLPMNTGAEAVEVAVKAARRWAYQVKGVPRDEAEVIVCQNNFHGRTMLAVSMSTSESATKDYGPMITGINTIPYGDSEALESAITSNTAAFIVEPIQGEGGVVVPPDGYLKEVQQLCAEHNILFIADEIQTGLGRTGKMFACDWEGVTPDIYILGKALGGGVYPVSCIAADNEIMDVFEPGSHGSTFGGNPLAASVALASLDVIKSENLPDRAEELGKYFRGKLQEMQSSHVKEVRGKGLLIGMELNNIANNYCKELKEQGVLAKDTKDYVIRFAPPLTITKQEIDFALEKISLVFSN